jgi:bifunctional non-homologous end joining protein LigD
MAFQRKKPPAIGFKAPYPGFIEPALATSIDKVPNGERWIHEIKFDGYRVQLHIANESTTVFTRTGIDWTRRFQEDRRRCVLDQRRFRDHRRRGGGARRRWHHGLFGAAERTEGQVDQDRDGRLGPALSQRLRPAEAAARGAKLSPEKADRQDRDTVQRNFRGRRPEMYKHACAVGLEGVVSKVRDSRYPAGRGNDWVKTPARSARHWRSPASR